LINKLLFWLKVSRPGLWFATGWLYLLPTSQMDIWSSTEFWIGYFYITFPINFLVYGWNDIVDREVDLKNPRKDTFWFGAKGSKQQLEVLWKPILLTQLPFFCYFTILVGWKMILLFLGFIIINGLYNLPKNGLRSRPPWELACQVGYLLIVPLSILINDAAPLPWQTYLYLLLFAFQSHLIGEVMDISPDRLSGRRTTATKLGLKKTKLLIIGIVFLEVALLFFVFKEYIFGGMLAFGLLWLIIDLALVFKTKIYTVEQMKLFGLLSNIIAICSMTYVWFSGCLLQIP
jgi:4-hydroxybenzoate polyprenyltransferase